MASIPGSHFVATAPNQLVNVVETSGGPLPPPRPGEFNLEVWTGNPAAAPSQPAHHYQGLAVLSQGGAAINLIAGTYAVTDNGSGRDTIGASGDYETISGGAANVTLNLFGNDDVANGGGQDTISVYGKFDTVHGAGNDRIAVYGDHDSVNGGTGNDTINIYGRHDTVTAGSGNKAVSVSGDHDQVTAGTGNVSIDLSGDHDAVSGGIGNETVNVHGSHDSVDGGSGNAVMRSFGDRNTIGGSQGNDTILVFGDHSQVDAGDGLSDIRIAGGHDTVEAGSQRGANLASLTVVGAAHFRFNDGPHTYHDSVVGFDQAAGDRIHLTTDSVSDALAHSKQVNGGHDTLITLQDGSTILLKGVSHIDHGFFN
jgi:hypothetical protein